MAKTTKGLAKLPKRGPKALVLGVVDGTSIAPSDFASLVGDLSAGDLPREPEWRVHDRTHLEFAVDYRVGPQKNKPRRATTQQKQSFEWDAYFFVPESLRLHDQTYAKNEIYEDLQSYVRFAVPAVPFDSLAGDVLERLRAALGPGRDDEAALRELRLFACLLRASSGVVRRNILTLVKGLPETSLALTEATQYLVQSAARLATSLRAMLDAVPAGNEALREACSWIDEDVSRALEALLGSLAIELRKAKVDARVVAMVAAGAVEEAQARAARGLEGVGHAHAHEREIEHLEFRRHVLKRFTSSVLWLSLEVRSGARWALELLYAVAASVAMGFAFVAAMLHGGLTMTPGTAGNLWTGAFLVMLAYAAKDRIKAALQGTFSRVVQRHFPDRRWRILDREREVRLGEVEERSAFLPFKRVPPEALAVRRMTRTHLFEESARPERVLWHHKTVTVHGAAVAAADARFTALTEIFRLNLRRWLDHTDDPNRKIVFADPDDRQIYSAIAPRVYNIAIVYRLREHGKDAPWHRIRVVVTRKGIRRIDRIC
jgi:hypothetical protein